MEPMNQLADQPDAVPSAPAMEKKETASEERRFLPAASNNPSKQVSNRST